MKLSVCIPIYNFDANDLVNQLIFEIHQEKLSVEIIIIDDASNLEFRSMNKEFSSKISKFIQLEKNIGRSKIRNLFLNYSSGEYLLFLDCDGKINNSHFLQNYLLFITANNPQIVFGGRILDESQQKAGCELRANFASKRENLSVDMRNRNPYLNFQTNNFIVRKDVLVINPFNENITQYGYEDLEFSFSLKEKSIKIDHIDNPIINKDLEVNKVFLDKADQSAFSLSQILQDKDAVYKYNEIRLLKTFSFFKKTGLLVLFSNCYKLLKPIILSKLLKGDCSLRYLDVYKLGQLSLYMKTNKE